MCPMRSGSWHFLTSSTTAPLLCCRPWPLFFLDRHLSHMSDMGLLLCNPFDWKTVPPDIFTSPHLLQVSAQISLCKEAHPDLSVVPEAYYPTRALLILSCFTFFLIFALTYYLLRYDLSTYQACSLASISLQSEYSLENLSLGCRHIIDTLYDSLLQTSLLSFSMLLYPYLILSL